MAAGSRGEVGGEVAGSRSRGVGRSRSSAVGARVGRRSGTVGRRRPGSALPPRRRGGGVEPRQRPALEPRRRAGARRSPRRQPRWRPEYRWRRRQRRRSAGRRTTRLCCRDAGRPRPSGAGGRRALSVPGSGPAAGGYPDSGGGADVAEGGGDGVLEDLDVDLVWTETELGGRGGDRRVDCPSACLGVGHSTCPFRTSGCQTSGCRWCPAGHSAPGPAFRLGSLGRWSTLLGGWLAVPRLGVGVAVLVGGRGTLFGRPRLRRAAEHAQRAERPLRPSPFSTRAGAPAAAACTSPAGTGALRSSIYCWPTLQKLVVTQ